KPPRNCESRTGFQPVRGDKMETTPTPSTTLKGLQDLIRHMYFEKDRARGIEGTWMWFVEEVGELSSALRAGSHEERLLEFADVLAWLATLANIADVDLSEAIARK